MVNNFHMDMSQNEVPFFGVNKVTNGGTKDTSF